MKTKKTALPSRKPTLLQTMAVVGISALVTLGGLPVHAATTSFPNYPLLTGGNAIPPNIMMILDDSGSMNFIAMPTDIQIRGASFNAQNGLNDNPTDRSYINNTLYYDPRTDYLPWRTSSTDLNDRLAAADFTNAASSPTNYTDSKVDLRTAISGNIQESYFYVPKSGVSSPGTSASNYDKYRITGSSSTTSYGGGIVQKLTSTAIASATLPNIRDGNWSACIAVPVSGIGQVTITVSGSTRADLYVYSTSDCSTDWRGNGLYDSDDGNGNPKSLTITPNGGATNVYIRVNADGGNVNGPVYAAVGTSWVDMTPSGNTSALQQAELQNFANWYQYHRTRNKMAKAGASEAFGRLGENYRVGFDTIWNRGGGSANTAGSTPAYPIPYATNGGLFVDTNRTTFYDRLQAAGASSGTPLKGALQRAARYFSTDDPWKDSNGDLLTCRQNYAILTTDGYWNDNSGYTAVGNADAATAKDVDGNAPQYPDAYSDTLADVAYRYWSTDLRTAMANNVLTSAADPADWQHMVTFGVSIGLRGTLNPDNPAPSPWNVDPTTGGEGPKRIDDLWHASLNGRGKFVVANNSDKFASALIDALAAIDSRSASGSNIASSSTKTDTTTLTFVAGFTSGNWTGDLIASPFNAGLTGVSTAPKWILSKTFPGVTDTGNLYPDVNANFASRTVLTMKGGTASLFDNTMVGATDFAARTGLADAVTAVDNIAYLKGTQTKEQGQTGGTLRKRAWPIGDIVDSSPAYVEDTKTVYVGANDGMLHGINTDTGKVLFSYVPKGIDFAAMANLSATSYDHRYFVDGQIEVIGRSNQGSNKNILVGALGRGGRGVFALDVTNPGSMDVNDVLWDNTTQDSTTNTNMGYVLGAVRIRKGNGGKTYAFVPNGIDSPNGSATLFVYELGAGGTIVGAPTELVADAGGGNGLMSLGMADLNADGVVDVVYGGDLKGNVYRWDFSTAAMPASAVKLFQAKDSGGTAQPITGGIGVGRDSSGNVFVGFGTGRFISSNDMPGVGTSQVQSIYGLKDENATIASRDNLQARTIPFEGTTSAGEQARGFENYSTLSADKKGWYIDLATPERVISAPTIYGTAMILSSVIPATGSDCAGATGSGFLNALNLFTGTSPASGGYFGSTGTVTDADGNKGTLGSVGVTGGMPTEANVTSGLATVGTGAFSIENGGEGNTGSTKLNAPPGGNPSRVNWREVVPNN
ncbi:pilus assembly protein [Pseudoxanthomonas yeongjuensis]|uniref:pilus assembly protein n=1 Tax=Pseudoxanthomonas yeongjuensis TaxID=377616 RepID=UPI001391D04C|nr:PilC/PilY family type IV pilus protein [Pseudoxanthomonas yeongjuensis]